MPGEQPGRAADDDICASPDLAELIDNRYQLLHLLGVGGMGRVFKARDIQLERLVAIKLLHAHKVQDRAAVQRLRREAKSLSDVRHHNICEIYQVALSPEGQLYIVSEFVDGMSLKQRLSSQKTIAEPEVLAIFRQVLQALQAVHERGLIHRDITPANILITADGAVKLIDFGIAKSLDGETGQKLTATGGVLGTPEFMSPEQLFGEPLDGRSDLFSVGVCLYRSLAGRLPWREGRYLAGLQKNKSEQPQPLPAGISKQTSGVIRQALSTDPAGRFATADGMAQALSGDAPYTVKPQKLERTLDWRLVASAVIFIGIAAAGYCVYQGQLRTGELMTAQYEEQYESSIRELLGRMKFGKESQAIVFARQAVDATHYFPATDRQKLVADLYLQAVEFGLKPITAEQLAQRDKFVEGKRSVLGNSVYAWLLSNSAWHYFILADQRAYAARREEFLRASETDFRKAITARMLEPDFGDARQDVAWYCKSVDKLYEDWKSPSRKAAFYDAVANDMPKQDRALVRIIQGERLKSKKEACSGLSDVGARMKMLKDIIDLSALDASDVWMFEVYREYGERLYAQGKPDEGLSYLQRAVDDLVGYKNGEEERGRLLVGMGSLNMKRRRPDLAIPEYRQGIEILERHATNNFERIDQALAELVLAYQQQNDSGMAAKAMRQRLENRQQSARSLPRPVNQSGVH